MEQMFSYKFGVEIEFTGITRRQAAEAAAAYLHGTRQGEEVQDPSGRIWRFVRDGSILCQQKSGRRVIPAGAQYSVELVTPVLSYRQDIGTLQGLLRKLKKAGGFTNRSCGIHIHLDGADHSPRSLWNFVNLVASRNDLFYNALQIPAERQRFCKKMDEYLVQRLNRVKPVTFQQIEQVWYAGYSENRGHHYHSSRYHFLNLHSFFHGNHTVELRGFNGTLHAGKLRSYVVFALAMNHQAISQKYARYKKVQSENEKFAMRVYLVRIGLSGDEFKNCRAHLYEHLSGNAAWRYGSKENCRTRRGTHG